ncbi:MAG: LysR family transcriptional regulator [Qingshengfaniella sp.]
MADIRDMQLLTALARHRHFARAAEECGISQPAFSARIRNLETDLGVPIVKRGNRFLGFTSEGDIVLKWARRVLSDAEGLRQEIELARGELSGRLSIGVIPTALSYVARIPAVLRTRHPGLSIQIYSLTTGQIHRGLGDFSLDAGIGYLEGDLPAALGQPELLYQERYVLLSPAELLPTLSGPITWAEAIDLPLCLLTLDMRNRRFLDEVFATHVGRVPKPVMETNDLSVLLTQVESGASATIAPAMLADTLPPSDTTIRLPMTGPEITTPIGLLLTDRDPLPPKILALDEALRHAAR